MYDKAKELINAAKKIMVIQAENPDGDSLGSALALEEILGDLGKQVSLYCPVEIPKYMRYVSGWDRVTSDLNEQVDLIIIVDTAADVLMTKILETPGARNLLESLPVLVIDHHETKSNLSFSHEILITNAVATGEIIYNLAVNAKWPVNKQAAENIMVAILSDSLGFTVQSVNSQTFLIASELTKLGANVSDVEARRREFMKKSPEILKYKGELIERIEYYLDGKIAFVHIPWEEIKKYSDKYNPSVLVLDEMRLVEGVELGIAIKTYPDGKLTGKIRSNIPISSVVAGFFGGGGHDYAAGFRVYEPIDTIIPEIIETTQKAISEFYKNDTKTF